jgi:hypothetical protein
MPKNLSPNAGFEDAVVHAVLEGPDNHDKLWNSLNEQDAALARGALVKAQKIRARDGDPAADAYLAGIADAQAVQHRAERIAELTENFNIDLAIDQILDAS